MLPPPSHPQHFDRGEQGRRMWRFRGLCSGAGPAATDVPTRGLLPSSLGPTGLLWSRCSYLKPDEDKKSKHKTAVKKKTLNPEFNEVGLGWVWLSPRGFSQPQT